jgi:hypothetical protein
MAPIETTRSLMVSDQPNNSEASKARYGGAACAITIGRVAGKHLAPSADVWQWTSRDFMSSQQF